MRKFFAFGALIAALAIPATAVAADLHFAHDDGVFSCPAGFVGTAHLVNNQTGGVQTPGTVVAVFSVSGSTTETAYMVNNNMQHFSVSGTGALLDADTNLPGNLVVSDFDCHKK